MTINKVNLSKNLYNFVKNNKILNIYIEELYRMQKDKLYWKFYKSRNPLQHTPKKEYIEFIIMWVLGSFCPFINKQIIKWGPDNVKLSSQNNQSSPDVRIGKKFYEITSFALQKSDIINNSQVNKNYSLIYNNVIIIEK